MKKEVKWKESIAHLSFLGIRAQGLLTMLGFISYLVPVCTKVVTNEFQKAVIGTE